MEASRDEVLFRLEQLSRKVDDLQRRVSYLEGAPPETAAPAQAAAASGPPELVAAGAGAELAADTAPNLMPLFGWALMGIAGAYLLRALAENGGMTGKAAAIVGIVYASSWLVLAARRATAKPVYSAVHGLTAALILSPMLWEMTVRFHLLPAALASAVMVGFVVLGLAIAWRHTVTAIAWTVTLAALVTVSALFRETHNPALWTLTILAVAVAVEVSACRDHWLGLRWVTAIAADLAVMVFGWLGLRAAGASETLVTASPGVVLGAQIALLTIYLASTVDRTIFRHRVITVFEIGQTAAAFLISVGGAVRVTESIPAAGPAVGLFCVLAGAACYAVSFAFLNRDRARDRNFYTYSTFAVLLMALGCDVLLSGPALVGAWATLAVAMMWTGRVGDRDTLRIHGAAYLLLAVAQSHMIETAVQRFVRPTGLVVSGLEYLLAWLGATACYALLWRLGASKDRHWTDEVEAVVAAALCILGAAGIAAGWILQFSAAPAWRTALLMAPAVAAAWLGSRRGRPELLRLAYPLLAAAGVKVVMEDFQSGQTLALVVSLILFGSGLILLPRLVRR